MNRFQQGSLFKLERKSRPDVWVFRWYMDAVELSRDSGANRGPRFGRVMMNPTWPERIVFGHHQGAS